MVSKVGTTLFMAPEIGKIAAYDERVDTFSLAAVFYFIARQRAEQMNAPIEKSFVSQLPATFSSEFKNLLSRMLEPIDKRIHISEIIEGNEKSYKGPLEKKHNISISNQIILVSYLDSDELYPLDNTVFRPIYTIEKVYFIDPMSIPVLRFPVLDSLTKFSTKKIKQAKPGYQDYQSIALHIQEEQLRIQDINKIQTCADNILAKANESLKVFQLVKDLYQRLTENLQAISHPETSFNVIFDTGKLFDETDNYFDDTIRIYQKIYHALNNDLVKLGDNFGYLIKSYASLVTIQSHAPSFMQDHHLSTEIAKIPAFFQQYKDEAKRRASFNKVFVASREKSAMDIHNLINVELKLRNNFDQNVNCPKYFIPPRFQDFALENPMVKYLPTGDTLQIGEMMIDEGFVNLADNKLELVKRNETLQTENSTLKKSNGTTSPNGYSSIENPTQIFTGQQSVAGSNRSSYNNSSVIKSPPNSAGQAEILQYKQQIRELQQKMEGLKGELSQRTEEGALRAELGASKANVERLEDFIKRQDAHIDMLEIDHEEMGKQLFEKTNESDRYAQEVAFLRQRLNCLSDIETKSELFKHQEFEKNKELMKSYNSSTNNLKSMIDRLTHDNEAHKKQLAAKENAISQRERDLVIRLEEALEKLKEKDNEVLSLNQVISLMQEK
eukprot:gene4240-4947_t